MTTRLPAASFCLTLRSTAQLAWWRSAFTMRATTPAYQVRAGRIRRLTTMPNTTAPTASATATFPPTATATAPLTPTATATATVIPCLPATISLPTATVTTAVTDFTQSVTTSTLNSSDGLVGFQGDFTFDETVVTF